MTKHYASLSKSLGSPPRRAAGWWLLLLLLSSMPAWAQNTTYTIRGTVTDISNSQGVPGATVRLTGTVLGGATNADGVYDLRAAVAPGTYQLVVSSVGYANSTQTITLGADPTVTANVQLRQDLIGLKEVVVTGTSIATSKQQLGNAISTVGGRELTAGAPTQIDQALQGKIAGAQISQNSGNPAGGISVRLRGTSTVLGSSEPLYLVDGVIINNDSPALLDLGGYAQNRLADINPNDIERIEVIKGAAAAAIYGSRAANGVVQIFTKRGKEGKPSVTVSSEFIVSKLRKKLDYNRYPFRFANTTATDLTQVPVERYDYQDQIFRTAIGTENYASISGGNQSTKYTLSGSYFKNQGIIDATDFNRNTGRVRLQQTLTNWASISGGASYTLSTSNEVPNGGINEAYGALTGFIFSNNFINPQPNEATGVYPSTTPTSIVTRTNPLEAINRFKFQQRTSRVIGDVQLNLTPFEGFTVDNVFGFDTYTQIGTAFIPPGNTTPTYSAGYARRGDQTVLQYNNDLTLGYRRTFADWLESTTSLGGTWQYDRTMLTSIASQQLVTGVEVSTGGTYLANDYRAERRIEGYFLQQTFGLGQRLYLTGAIRFDAASPFYDNLNQDRNWQRYLKASGSYLLSEEKFWKEGRLGELVPQVKLRSSWGQAGNLTALDPYGQYTLYAPVSLGGQQGLYPGARLGNQLIPERQREFELGFDIGLFNNRVGLEATYFDKHVTDLLLNRTLSPSTGYLNRNENVGTMDNRGVELLVRAVPVQTSKVLWNITGTFTHNRNEVNGIEGNGVLPFDGGFGQVAAVNGQPVGVFYSTYFARNPDGSLLLNAAGLPQRELGVNGVPQRNAAGQPTGSVLNKVIGNPNPKYLASLINEVTVNEKLSFRVQLDAVQGFDVFNFTRRVGDRDIYGGLAGYEAELRGDVPKGTSAALFGIFENWIEDGSFVKVREASVSYLFAPKFLGLKNIRATVTGRNLFVFTNYSGYDPEINAAGQSTVVRGFDFVEVPIPRTVRLGLSASF
ncbi:SusC/RagA family TonB-linked outer membrane protein [Hymenobacter defluvii]|uniref:SusC/RagA family TonB-linked outer membrane protein n=1 Tax=Hymenobacter defluvii TaxID=2054411 RepID=A0ABS3T9J5_9BACT|nr:SusC/RagA family TonB-linked outer membrane protein [Hymenobacter defluvii]MBO3269294.1 SusC/RagA family TonB-linked outer membrane protein [Hymenobacter defluvii]